jgi:glycosyltransferase involved in cell wall biosynthesis
VRLGVVTTSYPRFPGDAAGSFVAGHVAALAALGHEVEIIAAGPGSRADGDCATDAAPIPADASAHAPRIGHEPPGPGPASHACTSAPNGGDAALRVIRVGSSPLFYHGGAPDALERAPLRTAAWAALFSAQLTASVTSRARRWDAIIAHWLIPSALAALPARPRLIAIAHGGDVFTLRRLHLLRPVLSALRRRGARLVFVSEPLRAVARDAAPTLAPWLDEALVQPMGLDLARFTALVRAPRDPPMVLVAGRLVPIKGIEVAIAAMAHVTRAAELVIAGDGPERARLAAAPGTHRLLGEVSTERRDHLLRIASVVVVPSRVLPSGRTEGTPMIALEALAAGVPVIASGVGGLRDVPGVCLVSPGDPRMLARAIDQVLAYPPAPQALRAGVAMLDWREVAARLLRE